MQDCPCGTGKSYLDCCGVFISGKKPAATPEELMRSRYTAYTQVDMAYITRTMKSPAADNFNADDRREQVKKIRWTGLDVIRSSQDGIHGIVEFIAYYDADNKKNFLHEVSEFNFENGEWFYTKGKTPEKIGRNDICPCGSLKKFKKCCGAI